MGIERLGADGRTPQGGPATGQATGASWSAFWELGADATAAARARALTRRTLILWRADEPADVDDVVLMVDELVTNAIVHGTGPARLWLHLEGRELTVEVGDDSPLVPAPRYADPATVDWAETGRGLLLVSVLAGDHGTRPAGHGKVVWFTRLLRRADPPRQVRRADLPASAHGR